MYLNIIFKIRDDWPFFFSNARNYKKRDKKKDKQNIFESQLNENGTTTKTSPLQQKKNYEN